MDFFFLQLNLGIFTADKKSELSILVDRATGGASIADGQLELMLHRFKFSHALTLSILLISSNICYEAYFKRRSVVVYEMKAYSP